VTHFQAGTEILTPEHWRELVEDSAIRPEILAEEDIRSLPSSLGLPTPDPALRHPNTHKGDYFGVWGETDKQHRPLDLGPGLWFGTRDVHGRLSGQYKPVTSRTAFNGNSVKYETCRGTRPSFAVPRRSLDALVNTMCDVFFTEGYKKALALASAGACAISLAGVDSWTVKPDPNNPASEPVEDFDAVTWRGRIVWIAYDSDAVLKPGVQWAEKRLTTELESRGAIVMVIRIPHASDGSKRGIDDYFRDRLAAGVSREDALCELKAFALAEVQDRARRKREPATSSDGAETCTVCPKLKEQIAEFKSADALVKHGPFTPDGAQVHRHLVDVANAARRNGKEKIPLLREDVARLALGATGTTPEKAVSRALKAYTPYQDDPELLATLPYRLEWREAGRKTHIDLYPLTPEEPQSKDQQYTALRRLPKDRKPVTKVIERDDSCRRCHSPEGVETRGTRRCLNEECGHTWHTRPIVLGRVETPAPEPTFLVAELPGHFVPASTSTYAGQNVPANDQPPITLVPVSFVSRDDLAAASGKPWPDPAPPEPKKWTPPPIAPSHHIAAGFRRVPRPAVAGGSE